MFQITAILFRYKDKLFFLLILFLFLMLLFKDPFSDRTLIPNLEPYPDTLYYTNTALNFVKGNGFHIAREGRVFNANVPPLYSFILAPFYFLKADPRSAYFANIFLAIVSFLIFVLILRKITANRLIIYFVIILYATNYFIYWIPTIIMAENLTLTLYLAAVYLFLAKAGIFNSAVTGFLAVAIYTAKFASIPVSGSIFILFFVKTLLLKEEKGFRIKNTAVFLAAVAISYFALQVFLQINNEYSIFAEIFTNLSLIRETLPGATPAPKVPDASIWFGTQFIKNNLPMYIYSLIGNPNKFLWDQTPLLPKLAALGGIAGILGGIFYKRLFFISLTIFIFISSLVLFQSTFYSFDARYIYVAIPSLLFGLGIFLSCLSEKIREKKNLFIFHSLILFFIILYFIFSFTRIKSQIILNLRYKETPWNYIAVLKMNEYFTPDKIRGNKKPVLVSALPPLFIDYYSNSNFTLLPLSYEQEFRGEKMRRIFWGPKDDYSDLSELYRKYLEEDYDLYVSRAGIGNESYTNNDFNTIVREFDIKLVLPGCYEQCNIYSLKLKSKNEK